MIIRIIRLPLAENALPVFLRLFEEVSPRIRGYAGCRHLELWQDVAAHGVVTSCSHWDSVEVLEAYRHSALFADIWSRVKPLLGTRAQAFSARRLVRADAGSASE